MWSSYTQVTKTHMAPKTCFCLPIQALILTPAGHASRALCATHTRMHTHTVSCAPALRRPLPAVLRLRAATPGLTPSLLSVPTPHIFLLTFTVCRSQTSPCTSRFYTHSSHASFPTCTGGEPSTQHCAQKSGSPPRGLSREASFSRSRTPRPSTASTSLCEKYFLFSFLLSISRCPRTFWKTNDSQLEIGKDQPEDEAMGKACPVS